MDRQYLGQFALALILIINVVFSKKIYKNKYNNNNNKQQYDDAIVSLVEEESKDLACGNFSAPTFCDMINWQVAKTRLVATDNQEMIIQMAFFNQPGTWNCKNEYKVPFLNEIINASNDSILYDSMQSEEGGRFYKEQNRNLILNLGENFPTDLPENYIWMTLNQLLKLIEFNNYLNISARSLISVINLTSLITCFF